MKTASVTKMFIRARESVVRNTRGQTMTEYALSWGLSLSWSMESTRRGNNLSSLASGVDSERSATRQN